MKPEDTPPPPPPPPPEGEEKMESLRRRYDVAIQLGEKLLHRVRQYKNMLRERLTEMKRRYIQEKRRAIATSKLLEAVVRKYRKERVAMYVESLLQQYPEIEKVKDKLYECTTVVQAKALVEELIEPLMRNKGYPSDLPPISLTEGVRGKVPDRRQGTNVRVPRHLLESVIQVEKQMKGQ